MADVENLVTLPRGFTEVEAAKILTNHGYPVTAETLRKHRRYGKISYRKVGGMVRYTEADLLEFVDRAVTGCVQQVQAADAGSADQVGATAAGSADTGSRSSQGVPAGTRHGLIPQLDGRGAEALANRI